METFGQRLRQAVKRHGLPLEYVANETGLDIEHIHSLERDDFGSLPNDEVVRRALRSLARLVEVDPDQVIADFLEERQRSLPRFEPEPPRPPAGRAKRLALPVVAILVVAIVAFLFWPRASTVRESGMASAVAEGRTQAKETAVEPEPLDAAGIGVSPLPDTPARIPETRETEPPIETPTGPSRASIIDHGVGKGLVDHDLAGETTRFAEGERVWFWNRVEGGSAGETINHVWIHEGVEELHVPLRLGGARWRTHSYKDLYAGSAGSWAVETRDRSGHVLARSEFTCSPRRGGS